jgi:hypothetical protein
MMTAETMRKNAEHCRALAEGATSEPVRTRYLRTAAAWDDLANSQDWLDGALRSSLIRSAEVGHRCLSEGSAASAHQGMRFNQASTVPWASPARCAVQRNS